MVNYQILRVQKVKGGGIHAMQYHNERQPGEHTNTDIDPSRTHLNRELCPHGDYRDEIEDRISRFRTSKRAVRRDAVKLAEGIVTASPEFFAGLDDDETQEFFDDCWDFLTDWFGEQNMVHGTVHLDETTPHMHFGAVPIKDGQLSWKRLFDGRDGLKGFQDAFQAQVGRKWGLDRGETDTSRRHRDMNEMKRTYERELRQLREERDELAADRDRLREQVGELSGQVSRLTQQVEHQKTLLERVEARFDGLMQRLSGIVDALNVLQKGRGVFESLNHWMSQFMDNIHVKAGYEAAKAQKPATRGYVKAAERGIENSVRREASRLRDELKQAKDASRELNHGTGRGRDMGR